MQEKDRKAAIAAYKQREAIAGIYALHCAAAEMVWVGHSPNVDRVRNRLWFVLGLGTHPLSDLQAVWTAHGPEGFRFEELERMKDDVRASLRDDWLKARAADWRERLNARAL